MIKYYLLLLILVGLISGCKFFESCHIEGYISNKGSFVNDVTFKWDKNGNLFSKTEDNNLKGKKVTNFVHKNHVIKNNGRRKQTYIKDNAGRIVSCKMQLSDLYEYEYSYNNRSILVLDS